MDINGAIKKIDRYLKKDSVGSLIVDVQNKGDLEALVTQYRLPQNAFVTASDAEFCKQDEFPTIATLIDQLHRENKNFFVREVSSFLLLKGEKYLRNMLAELLSMSIAGHVIIFTWQCEDYLKNIIENDLRVEGRICIVVGAATPRPKLVLTLKGIDLGSSAASIIGINQIAQAVESELADTIYIETNKGKESYPLSVYAISDMKDTYEVLCEKDHLTTQLDKSLGQDEDWQYVLTEFNRYPSWGRLISAKIGNVQSLDAQISDYKHHESDRHWRWLYLIGLKLFHAGEDWCLNTAAERSNSLSDFIRNIYRAILEISPHSVEFEDIYKRRKAILSAIGNHGSEVADFCKIVLSKEREAIYYLTDNTMQEKELTFLLLDKYGLEYAPSELSQILKTVYPDLYYYLEPYHFKNDLLDRYFQDYKYQKLINQVLPEFMDVVEQQAVARDYNMILKARSSVIEGIDRTNAQTYFTDAMGVEYLGYILSRCRELSLLAKVTVCRCELPSITSQNKEFWDLLSTEQYPIKPVSGIDDVKHHGKGNSDYTKTKLPIHLIEELGIIDGLLETIQADLAKGDTYSKAILISDHGASRLAVIHEPQNLIEMTENGNHSGRCCPKSVTDDKPECAVDADDFWAMANYDRFRGSRRAEVEVHGGATLEEVTVPIIELTYLQGKVEIKLMPLDAPASFTGVPEIRVGRNRPAAIKIFASQKLMDVSIEIDGHSYSATRIDDNFYVVEKMPEIRRAKLYSVDVFTCGNMIESALPLRVRSAGMSEKSIL